MATRPERAVPTSTAIIRSYYLIAFGYTLSASIIWGVNTLFLLDAGLSIGEVFIANSAFTAGMVLFEIPTGVVADTLGRRVSFLLSIAVLALATTVYVFVAALEGGVVAFSIVSVFLGLGFTFYSGAVEAWLVDALGATGYEGTLDHVFARGQQFTGVAMLIGSIGGGFLGQVDLSLPYYARILLLVALFAVASARMHDIGFEPRSLELGQVREETVRVAHAGISIGWGQRPIRLIMIAGALQSGAMFYVMFAWQPFLLDLLGREEVWIAGFISAGIALSTIVGNQIVDVWTRRCGHRTTMLISAAALLSVSILIMGLTSSFAVATGALMLMSATLGIWMPVKHAYLHALIPTDQRATVISFDSMIAGVGSTGGQLALGTLADRRSFSAGFVVGAVVSAVAVPILVVVRRLHSPADEIVGVHAGVEGSCAGHGIPPSQGVYSEPREPALSS